jgi:cyclopropane-fatty-acyl-phospholipid synthase
MNKVLIDRLLAEAGITVDGKEPCDIRIKSPKFYRRILRDGSIGLGESYMEGWWECDALDEFFCKLFSKQIEKEFLENFNLKLQLLKSKLFNLQTKSKSQSAIVSHYDIGNDLYGKIFDPLMIYSCDYAAKNYKVNVVGITISKEQHEVAKMRCNGLNVEIRFQDYRDIDEQFDRIVSIGMLEHVGYKNYKTFMETISRSLKKNWLNSTYMA